MMGQGVHSDIIRTKIEHKERKGDVTPLKSNFNRKPSISISIAHIIKTFPDKHGIVRTIKLRLGDAAGADEREWVWPITEILLRFFALLSIVPDREHWKIENIGKLPSNFGGFR